MAGLTRTLPKSVYIAEEGQKAKTQINSIVSEVNGALFALQQMSRDLGVIPDDLPAISSAWLTGVVSAKIAAVEAMPLSTDTISAMVAEWRKIERKATQLIDRIQSYKSVVPRIRLEMKDGSVICTNADKWICAKATYHIPDEYFEHYRLLCNVVEAESKLRHYEEKHDIPSKSLQYLLSAVKSPDDYAALVADGVFSQHLTQEQFNRKYKYELAR